MTYRCFRVILAVGAALVLAVATGAFGPVGAEAVTATMCDSALTQIESDGFTGDRFTFCVIGDTRVPGLAEIFPQNLREMNLLAPAFIVDVGDLIMGANTVSMINRQWDDFSRVCAASQVPLVPLVGNHDVWDWQSRAIYRQRIGPLAFSFSYGNAHFICLDTEEPGHKSDIGPAQLRWLKEDLEAHRSATNIFVFMHMPVWGYAYGSNWLSEVHPLLVKYPVKAVFAGHEHIYRKDVVDGIPCFITGGGGAEIGRGEGSFYHYMHVSVKGEQVNFAVVKTGGVASEDVVMGNVITTGE